MCANCANIMDLFEATENKGNFLCFMYVNTVSNFVQNTVYMGKTPEKLSMEQHLHASNVKTDSNDF